MNLLITGAWANASDHFAEVEAMGHRISFLQQERDPLPCDPDWVEGVVCNGLFLYHPISLFKNLRFIQLTSAGFDRVDMEYVHSHGIEIRNARGVYSIPMAEFAVCGVLRLYKQTRFFEENRRSHRWEKHRGLRELFGKTVVIVGCGSVGSECAKRFSAFGCRVIGIDILPRRDDAYESMLPLEKLDDVLPNTDVLVLTVPLSKETEHLIDASRLDMLPKTAVIVNIARGRVLDESALRERLLAGSLFGAVLDVFENEPLPDTDPIWDAPNTVITPHNSFVGEGNQNRLFDIIKESLK